MIASEGCRFAIRLMKWDNTHLSRGFPVHVADTRRVVGSNPTRGARNIAGQPSFLGWPACLLGWLPGPDCANRVQMGRNQVVFNASVMDFNDLTEEQREKARACKTTDELVELAENYGNSSASSIPAQGFQNVTPSIPTQAPRFVVRWQK